MRPIRSTSMGYVAQYVAHRVKIFFNQLSKAVPHRSQSVGFAGNFLPLINNNSSSEKETGEFFKCHTG